MMRLCDAMMNGILRKEDPAMMFVNISKAFREVHEMVEKMGLKEIPEGKEDRNREKEGKEEKEIEEWREERMLQRTKRSVMAHGIADWELGKINMNEIDMEIQAEIVSGISEYRCNVEEVRIFKNAAGKPASALIVFSSYGNKLNFFRCVAHHMRNRTEVGERMKKVSFRDSFPQEHNDDFRDLTKEGMDEKRKGKITSFRIVAKGYRCCPVLEGRNRNGAWHVMSSRYCNGQKREGRERKRREGTERRKRDNSQNKDSDENGMTMNKADKYLTTKVDLGEEAKRIMMENPEEYYFQIQHKLGDLMNDIRTLENFRDEAAKTEKWRQFQEKKDSEDEAAFEEY